ncbi:unnamed protein product [Caenorhabditis auriculariae]|uniref:Uncharacterized protein n=1 Tax=Caenorhabditis auriculariae TaxID=2777116 RepID=A0A8S1GUU7_9PELO|nr:unnamed protein product [Caenorhabditis auriculariae]
MPRALTQPTETEMAVNTRSSTPRPTPNEKVTNNTQQERFEQLDFPEFPPRPSSEIDVQYADDSASIATSAEDDSAFDLEITVVDEDPFGAETAAEAVTIDANILNDRIYKSTMARVGNILIANLSSTSIVGNVHESNLKVFGNVKEIEVKYQLKVLRQEINEMLKKSPVSTPAAPPRTAIDVVKFELNSPANMPTSFLEAVVEGLQAELDDEIIAHLSPFALDDHVSDNKLRLKVAVKNSNIQIVDRKKKKPLRVRIRDCIIEQDED